MLLKKNGLLLSIQLLSLHLFAQWVPQNPGTFHDLLAISFVNKDTGYAGGSGSSTSTFIRTYNGGITWTSHTGPSNAAIASVHFFNTDTGYCIDRNTRLFYTTNGGTSWTYRRNLGFYTTGSTGFYTRLTFITPKVGFFSLNSNKIFRTRDGGLTWDSAVNSITPITQPTAFAFLDTTTGYMTMANGSIFKTLNGGASWAFLAQPTTSKLNDIVFINANTGFAVGNLYSQLYKTTNGGTSWSTINLGVLFGTSYRLKYTSTGNFFLMNSHPPHVVMVSSDSCSTWRSMAINYLPGGLFNNFTMVNDTIGYGIGYSGVLYKTYPTADASPTIASSGMWASDVTDTTLKLHWLNGNGNNRLIVARMGDDLFTAPAKGNMYTANAEFGLGSTTGTGNFVVFNGPDTGCTITGLTAGTRYYFRIYDYNGTHEFTTYLHTTTSTTNALTLPVTWLLFNAKASENKKVDLVWQTASEFNNRYFEILRSYDMHNWTLVSMVKGNNTSRQVNEYTYRDESVFAYNTIYYKLKQVDFDNRMSYSQTVTVNVSETQVPFAVFPNPNSGSFEVNLDANLASGELVLYNLQGNEVSSHSFVGGAKSIQMKLKDVSPGLYMLLLRHDGGITRRTILIQ